MRFNIIPSKRYEKLFGFSHETLSLQTQEEVCTLLEGVKLRALAEVEGQFEAKIGRSACIVLQFEYSSEDNTASISLGFQSVDDGQPGKVIYSPGDIVVWLSRPDEGDKIVEPDLYEDIFFFEGLAPGGEYLVNFRIRASSGS